MKKPLIIIISFISVLGIASCTEGQRALWNQHYPWWYKAYHGPQRSYNEVAILFYDRAATNGNITRIFRIKENDNKGWLNPGYFDGEKFYFELEPANYELRVTYSVYTSNTYYSTTTTSVRPKFLPFYAKPGYHYWLYTHSDGVSWDAELEEDQITPEDIERFNEARKTPYWINVDHLR